MAEEGEAASGATRTARSLRSLVQNLLLSVVTSLLFVAGVEGLCRWMEPKEAAPAVAPSITDWAQWEGDFYTVKATAAGWPPFEDYNQDGLRDREHETEKPAGVRRVVFLGDSTTVGFRIRPEEAYPQVLQDRLDALGPKTEVFNVALGGWSTRQELIAYRRIARRYRPDHVLVGICLNDIPEMGNNLSRPPAWMASLTRRSALGRRVVAAPQREIRSVEELFWPGESPKVKAAYERFFEDLRALRKEVEQDGARFGMLVFPFRLQVEPDAPPPRPQQRIADFCAAERIPCLDLLPALREEGETGFVDYDHFSPSGSERVAEEILGSSLLPDGSLEASPSNAAVGAGSLGGPAAFRPASGTTAAVGPSVVDLIASLAKGDAPTRSRAARELGQRGAEAREALPVLVGALGDDSAEVRRASAWTLGRIGPRPAFDLPALARALEDPDPAVRAGAAWALGQMGRDGRAAGVALVGRLRDADADVRRRAAKALLRIDPDPAPCLPPLQALIEDAEAPGRAEAARVLGALRKGAEPAVPALVRALGDGTPEVRREVVTALGALGPAAASAAMPALLVALEDPTLRWRVPDTLGAFGPAAAAAVPALTAALRDPQATVRWRSAIALGRIGGKAAAASPDLARLLTDPQPNVRVGAVVALSRVCLAAPRCAPGFEAALRDTDSQVRTKAAEALERLGEGARASVPALVGALSDDSPWVRVAAVRALARAGQDSAVAAKALRQALSDDEEMVRQAAERALAEVSGPSRDVRGAPIGR